MSRQSARKWVVATLGAALMLTLLAVLASFSGGAAEPADAEVYVAVDRQAAQQAWANARARSLAEGD